MLSTRHHSVRIPSHSITPRSVMISTAAAAAAGAATTATRSSSTITVANSPCTRAHQIYTLLCITISLLFVCAFMPHVVRASTASAPSSSSSIPSPDSITNNDSPFLFYTTKPTKPYVSPRAHLQPRATLPVRTRADIIADATVRWKRGLQMEREAARGRLEREGELLSDEMKARLQFEMQKPDIELPPVPGSWDPRNDTHWNHTCPSLSRVRDQGDCAADWAATVASTFTDRLCIQTNGTLKQDISIQDILSCCGWKCGLGCNGGYSWKAWQYLSESGAVTGTSFNTSGLAAGCLPYQIPPCHLTDNNGTSRPCDSFLGVTKSPVCVRKCQDGHEWEYDKYYSFPPYQVANDQHAIEAEIFYNGPVSATIDLYQDFLDQLPNNIYRYQRGELIGALTIKLLGYATEQGVDFWYAAPTWGADWGANNGFFKMFRGFNECNVEASVYGAMIRIYNATAPKDQNQTPVTTPLFAKHLGIHANAPLPRVGVV